jgi:hypothetical protein
MKDEIAMPFGLAMTRKNNNESDCIVEHPVSLYF